LNQLILKPGREKSVLQHHPWIFSGAVDSLNGSPQMGETVQVVAADRSLLGLAAYSPVSNIRARMWTWNSDEVVDKSFFERRIRQALALRQVMIDLDSVQAYRLVHAESDGLPGLVVDRYGDVLVMQSLTAGVDFWKETLADLLMEISGCKALYERSDVDVRSLEGLPEKVGLLRGEMPDGKQVIVENGIKFQVDIQTGQKTGFYVDQRANRNKVGDLARGRKVLNCFCYTGGFSLYALGNGAESVLSIDSSAEAIEMAKENLALNGFDPQQATWQEADVFFALRTLRDRAESFDMIILDPPKFAPTAAQAEKAARGYKDINLLAFKLLRPGGILATFSCSGGISADLFQKIVAGAALDAKVDARIVEYLHQGCDHPVGLAFPEGAYLKGLICQVRG
jgi:23S rRNA (cytosine1962-C5)-methyltransferase